jgi:hypothetical protein
MQFDQLNRRKLITLLGGAAAAWPFAAGAQQGERMRRVGMLLAGAAHDLEYASWLSAFTDELQKMGWGEGNNIRIDVRWASGDPSRLPVSAAELAALEPIRTSIEQERMVRSVTEKCVTSSVILKARARHEPNEPRRMRSARVVICSRGEALPRPLPACDAVAPGRRNASPLQERDAVPRISPGMKFARARPVHAGNESGAPRRQYHGSIEPVGGACRQAT